MPSYILIYVALKVFLGHFVIDTYIISPLKHAPEALNAVCMSLTLYVVLTYSMVYRLMLVVFMLESSVSFVLIGINSGSFLGGSFNQSLKSDA